ncbi:MAG: T9SS type A sorting domain-containing protein [Bacteroidales bacterium]|nr:T9SS type A sorting domain-containing protein [Lentimicrobium sp.]
MKKAVLISLSLVISFAVFGQQKIKIKEGLKDCRVIERVYTNHSSNGQLPKPFPASVPSGDRAVVLRQLGTSANGFGMLGVRQNLWADPAINAVSFIHRMHIPPHGPGSGFLAYDLSLNGGETWTNNIQVYEAPSADFNGRYPQGGIYNPLGNTDPDNAYQAYFAAVLDGSNNGTWGGYGYGVHKFSGTEPPTQYNVAATPEFLQGVPEAYTITSKGLAMCADPSNNGVGQPFADFFIITKGYFNPEIGDFEMDRFTEYMPAGGVSPVSGTAVGVADAKVAFSPDGEIGYISYLSNNGENTVESEGCYHPILYKTFDGGDSWDGPYNVQLGGASGLPVVLEYLTDELIEILFEPPYPDREDIPFTSAFDHGLTVDFNGNPHLIFSVGIGSQDWSIYTSHAGVEGCGGMVAMIHAFSTDKGETWYGKLLTLLKTFRGEFPMAGSDPSSEDNRPYLASTPDGTKLFFSWIDTDIEDYGENDQPDIYCVGYDAINNTYSEVYNVSQFTAAWYSSYMATGSKYALDMGDGTYKVPFAFQQIDPLDLGNPVQYWFVDNFILTDADLSVIQGTNELEAFNFSVSQNYPNPCKGYTFIDVITKTKAAVSVEISNLIGQTVWKMPVKFYNEGKHQLRLDIPELKKGVYLCNVQVDGKRISKKLIIN